MNIEEAVISYLEDALPVPVFADVPQDRPESLVTVERIGGSLSSVVIDTAEIAVQSWEKTRFKASQLAGTVDAAMRKLPDEGAEIISAERSAGPYNHPDPDHSAARYQSTYTVTFYNNQED